MSRRILFVDDEPNLLMGLQRTLRPMRAQWEMEFVSGGDEALQALSLRPFDAVVTDMRMPGMTGVELLERIQDQFPQTIRIILSGQSDRESILRSIAPAHQFLSKPCDAEQLKSVLERAIALTELLESTPLKKFISRLKCIPSLPFLYQEVAEELRSEDPSAFRIGRIIAKDMGMTAKILQVVNSVVYGVNAEVSEPSQAVMLLGLDTIQAMVLSLSIFSAYDPHVLSARRAERLWDHSVSVSRFSRLIARAEGVAAPALDPYQSAGLLHDIGKLVMASADPKGYREIEELAISAGTDQYLVETEVLGCSHAEIGAYLLGIWGLPASIVEAVAWHHRPSESPTTKFSPLVAVHVASAFHARLHPEFRHTDSHVDQAFLNRIGLGDRQDEWMKQCSGQFAEGRPRSPRRSSLSTTNPRYSKDISGC
jgi:putative nucleotidyltransferase with HDIG domain